jgi:HD-GYP domain-containing protein (c-di-GMP phosphodiesterase class II)
MAGQTVGSSPAETGYTSIPVRSLDPEAVVGCDLYHFVPPDRFVLYLSGSAPVNERLTAELSSRRVDHLYVRQTEASAYGRYLISRIEHLAEMEDCPVEEQAHTVMQGTHFLMERALTGLQTEAIRDLHDAIAATVDLAFRDPSLARAMMLLTRHDAYTYNHSVNVTVFGTALALAMGRERDWVRRVAQGLSVHDIGKHRIPRSILNSPGRLSELQWEVMRRHPSYGVEILEERGLADDPIVRTIVATHHERTGGRGYPRRLAHDQIPPEARVCAICDVFDALTSDRPYRSASPVFEGLRIVIDEMREEFDRDLLGTFIMLFGPDEASQLRNA